MIDMTEELRWLEYGQRLAGQARNVWASAPGRSSGEDMFIGAVAGGAQALGVAAGLVVGGAADLFSVDAEHPSLAGKSLSTILDGLVFAGGRGAIDTVWCRGEKRVSGGRHHARDELAARYRRVLSALTA